MDSWHGTLPGSPGQRARGQGLAWVQPAVARQRALPGLRVRCGPAGPPPTHRPPAPPATGVRDSRPAHLRASTCRSSEMRYPSQELEQASLRARQHLHRELQDHLGRVVAGSRPSPSAAPRHVEEACACVTLRAGRRDVFPGSCLSVAARRRGRRNGGGATRPVLLLQHIMPRTRERRVSVSGSVLGSVTALRERGGDPAPCVCLLDFARRQSPRKCWNPAPSALKPKPT